MLRFEIERPDPDSPDCERMVWVFQFGSPWSGTTTLELTGIFLQQRKSRRHKWRNEKGWVRKHHRDLYLPKIEFNLPESVIEDAKAKVIELIMKDINEKGVVYENDR